MITNEELYERIAGLPPDMQAVAVECVRLAGTVRAEGSPDADEPPPLPPLAWAEAHRRIDGLPFRLDRFKPLKQIYDDDHPWQAVMKPAQVGVSEMAITRAGHALDVGARYWGTGKQGLNVGYIFPTQVALSDFSKERVTSLKRESAHLARLFEGDFDDVTFKQARESFLYLRGGWSEAALLSFACDLLILDEYDRMSPKAVSLARKRLRASVVKRELDISTPTFPKVGIHALILQSDQQVWEVYCRACQGWTELDFFRDVRGDGKDFEVFQRWEPERLRRAQVVTVCPRCREDLDRLGDGRWTPREPDVIGLRGYQVPALSFPTVSPTELAVKSVSTDPSEVEEFYRSDLGLPYEPKGSRVTETMLKQLSHELPGARLPADVRWRDTTMGVDVGAKFHYRISSSGPGRKRYVRAMGFVSSWGGLDRLMEDFKVRRCVVDNYPETHGCEQWANKHRGKVVRASYPTANALQGKLFHPDEVEKIEDFVQINRTMAMDAVYSAVAAAKEHWPADVHNDPEVRAHMSAPIRVVEKQANGEERATWVHTKPDHFFHTCVYDHVAFLTLPQELPGSLGLGSVKGWGI